MTICLEVQSLAGRICDDPSTAVVPGENLPTTQILFRLNNNGAAPPLRTFED